MRAEIIELAKIIISDVHCAIEVYLKAHWTLNKGCMLMTRSIFDATLQRKYSRIYLKSTLTRPPAMHNMTVSIHLKNLLSHSRKARKQIVAY